VLTVSGEFQYGWVAEAGKTVVLKNERGKCIWMQVIDYLGFKNWLKYL